MKKILFINNGFGLSSVQSGGNVRHIKTLLSIRESFEIYCVTTIGGYENYKSEGIMFNKEDVVLSHLWKTKETSNADRVLSYFLSTFHSFRLILFKKVSKVDIVYSTSDYFCDVFPAVLYKIVYGCKLVNMVHHRSKSPLRREGSFLLNLVSFVFQRISFLLIHLYSDALFVYETPEGEEISKSIRAKKTFFVRNGVDLSLINTIPNQEEQYEASFAGGLRETKGIYDLLQVWKYAVLKHSNWRVAIAGGGTEAVTKDFTEKIKEAGLENNMVLVGPLDQESLYRLVKSSKTFVSTSHEEGWGISVLEAVALGTPVVAYELPAFKYLSGVITKVPLFNYEKMFTEIERIVLGTKKEGHSEYLQFVKDFDWAKIAEVETSILSSIIGSNEA